jgi:hypothetical protein
MKRAQLRKEFGDEIGKKIPLSKVFESDEPDEATRAEPNAAYIWEIWCKNTKSVIWFCEQYTDGLLKEQADPLRLINFFPCPRPLYAIEQHDTLVPAALFSQYEQQAKELNKISRRVNGIIEALRVRGIYDATLTELGERGAVRAMLESAGVMHLNPHLHAWLDGGPPPSDDTDGIIWG